MPKTKFENIVFTLFMSFLMVYAMICYNIALNMGCMSNQVFLLAFHELVIMWPVAFILEYFFVDKLAHYFAFKVVTPKDRPFFITLAISFYIICIELTHSGECGLFFIKLSSSPDLYSIIVLSLLFEGMCCYE